MAKKIMQFRYYGKDNSNNYPEVVTYNNLYKGNIFEKFSSISQLGIQAEPGTIFFLNNDHLYPIEIGNTGIYELDLQNYGFIYAIQFLQESLNKYPNENHYTDKILIDVIYEGEGA